MKAQITWVLLFLVAPLMAQDFQGKAIYQSKTSVDIQLNGKGISDAQKEQIMESMKKSMEKSFELTFDRSGSIYQEEERLGTPGAAQSGVTLVIAGSDQGKYYKNVQTQTYVNETDMFGKLFLVTDSLQPWDWKLTSETKKIGNYTCYKATAIKKPDTTLVRRLKRLDKNQDNEMAKDSVAQDSTANNSLLSRIEKPKDQLITAWYTPEIPISQGPGPYWGLPGLILEVTTERTAILCSKLILNPDKKEAVEPPAKGKKVSQAEYDEILSKKMEEMQERWQSNSHRKDGQSFSIEIKG
ncbi:GLPGLI family protein [Flagellimonas beolgyonensis]|uniref:GLPGLI family protein n=1 Tax=Flagellimonas beolgyonensis TaxID=864064 RepID=UPI003D64B70D